MRTLAPGRGEMGGGHLGETALYHPVPPDPGILG